MLIIKRVLPVVSTLVKEIAKESSLMRSYSTKAVVLKCSLSLPTNFLDNYKIFETTPKRLILDFVLSILYGPKPVTARYFKLSPLFFMFLCPIRFKDATHA